ncbi:hypothetical protein [Chloroflexus aggregans]|uniref:FAD dependent oxidoreductase n=1 Tax=Chloroflexus aggregans (strain MD-66 / DSM 9485) TaxID=326427 RepID=B8G3T5_CHLAD|nr:hypothetical protein [Chloroflexus aggregans]ACL25337.1 hypothetical protein Cagg_2465 [Chloroflexus aggregans DSM 9485]
MSDHFDVIIVGDTAAEAALAALLARDGRAVLLVSAGTTQPQVCWRGMQYDTFPPQWAGLNDGPYARIAAHVGVYLPVVRREPAWRVHLPARTIDVPSDMGQWRRTRRALFPAQTDAASRFWQAQETAAMAALRLAEQFDPLAQIQVLRQQRITVADMLRRYGLVDPALRHFIDTMLMAYGLPVSDHCAWSAGSVALLPPAETLVGNAATLSRLFVDALLRAGGEWRRHQRAVTLLTTPTRVVGIGLTGGERVTARVVVLGVAAWRLANHRHNALPAWATSYVALDNAQVPEYLPLCQIVDVGGTPVLISVSPTDDQAACRTLTVAMRLSAAESAQLRSASRHKRGQFRSQLAKVLQEAIAKVLPQIATTLPGIEVVAPLPDPVVPSARPPAAQAGLWLLRPPAWLPPGYDNGSGTLRLYRQLRGLIW